MNQETRQMTRAEARRTIKEAVRRLHRDVSDAPEPWALVSVGDGKITTADNPSGIARRLAEIVDAPVVAIQADDDGGMLPMACPFCGGAMERAGEPGMWRHPGSQMLQGGCILRGMRHPADVWNRRPGETLSQDEAVFRAVLNCGHTITEERVVLSFNRGKPGHNTLNQLHMRIRRALVGLGAGDRGEGG